MLPKSSILPAWSSFPIRIGCPVWRSSGWVGSVYAKSAEQHQALQVYSQTFPSVEGNSTFYSLPSLDLARRWADESAPEFHFCFKVPRRVSHELALRGCEADMKHFCSIMEPLLVAQKLGPIFLQLPPTFDISQANLLMSFVASLPVDFPWAIELRHRDWFGACKIVNAFHEMLRSKSIDLVLLDASYLHAKTARTPTEEISQSRKPNPPPMHLTTGNSPLVRLIGSDVQSPADIAEMMAYWSEWFERIVSWTIQGLRPHVFVHTPDDQFAPKLCHHVYSALQSAAIASSLTLPDLPVMPVREKRSGQLGFNFDD